MLFRSEPIIDDEIDILVEKYIAEAVSTWLPYIEINEIVLDYDDISKDSHKFGVEINFGLKENPNLKESVKINVNN